MADEPKFTATEFVEPPTSVTQWLSTGSTVLDLAIADRLPGGIPVGRITQLYGAEATAKTAILQEALGAAQRLDGMAGVDDTEQAWDDSRVHIFGIKVGDKNYWFRAASKTIEDLFDGSIPDAIKKYEASKAKGPLVYGLDSLTALPSAAGLKAALAKVKMSDGRAKAIGAGFQKYMASVFGPIGLTLIIIDQSRDNVGVMFGDKQTVSGGQALKFYASVRIKLNHMERICNTAGVAIGVKLGFLIRKNKVGVPFRSGTFRLLFDYGIDNTASNLEWLQEHDPVIKAKLLVQADEAKKLKNQSRLAAVEAEEEPEAEIADDEEPKKKKNAKKLWEWMDLKGTGLYDLVDKVEAAGREKELAKYVETVWRVVHQTPPRKEKTRVA